MKDKILVFNAGPVYPVKAMNQMRTHNMIRTLSKDFRVDLLTPYINEEGYNSSCTKLNEMGGQYLSIKSVKHKDNIIKKRAAQAYEYLNYLLFGTDKEVCANNWNKKEIVRIIKEGNYKIVISNYWEASHFFKDLCPDIYKILDPHYAVAENIDVLEKIKKHKIKYFFEKRRINKNIRMEREVIINSDLLIPLSARNHREFIKIAPEKPMLLIPDGADLDYFLSYPAEPDPHTILFYGAMGSAQNRNAFWRFYNNILPHMKVVLPDLKLLVVGSNPPDNILKLHDGKSVIITGFVKDVRPWLSKAWLKIIPLELGSGFRGRVIELMAMGIPVVGTHNALSSIGLENGEQGFISNDDRELVYFCIEILRKPELRNHLSISAKEYVIENYSLDSTFGELRRFLLKEFNNVNN